MEFKTLGIHVGEQVHLYLPDKSSHSDNHFVVNFIGYLPKKSIVVSTPRRKDGSLVLLTEGQPLIMRFVNSNKASTFSTKVLAKREVPFSYLHLGFPKDVQIQNVRKEPRVRVELDATITNHSDKSMSRKTKVVDLSPSGIGIKGSSLFAIEGDSVSVLINVSLIDRDEFIAVKCSVKKIREKPKANNLSKEQDTFFYGLAIEEIERSHSIVLHAFVYQELLKNMSVI